MLSLRETQFDLNRLDKVKNRFKKKETERFKFFYIYWYLSK